MPGGWLGDIMIIRADHQNNFLIISNDLANDNRLSFEARGFMLFLLSLPDNWSFNVKGLAQCSGLSDRVIMRIVKELKDCGYIEQKRRQDSKGHFINYEWFVYEAPVLHENRTTDKPYYGQTVLRADRTTANPKCGECVPIQSTNNNQVLNITSTNVDKKKSVKEKNPGKGYDTILADLSPDLQGVFAEFIKMRKAIKAPLTDRALSLAIKKAFDLAGGDEAKVKAIVEQSILNAWKGVYALKDDDSRGKAYTAPINGAENQLDRLTRLAIERAEGGQV